MTGKEPKEIKKVKVIKANHMLQAKVGKGTLDPKAVERSQKIMDSNKVDFLPLAREYLNKMDKVIQKIKENALIKEEAIQAITEPVMQLKANAAVFRYTLIGNLANIMLSFLEMIEELDENVLEIIDAHYNTLNLIVNRKMEGDGGVFGKQLEDELQKACKRYIAKRACKKGVSTVLVGTPPLNF